MTFTRYGVWLREVETSHPKLLKVLAWLCLAFWLYYAFYRQVAGPLNSDEIYFTHHLWLVLPGARQMLACVTSQGHETEGRCMCVTTNLCLKLGSQNKRGRAHWAVRHG